MEQLRTELSHLLGEKLSRVECVSEQAATALWFLYDAQGNPMPLLARSFTTPGVARQLAWKISTLARNGTVRMPVVYGVMTHEEHPGPDVLLLERLRGVPVEAPTRTPARWEQLQEQIVEGPAGVASAGQWRLRGNGRQYPGKPVAELVPPAGRDIVEHPEPVSGHRSHHAG